MTGLEYISDIYILSLFFPRKKLKKTTLSTLIVIKWRKYAAFLGEVFGVESEESAKTTPDYMTFSLHLKV